jgi:hypothetical protein
MFAGAKRALGSQAYPWFGLRGSLKVNFIEETVDL